MLHGTEAVVPLPDGKTIPINFNTEEMAKVFQTYSTGQKDLMATGGVPMTDEATRSMLSNPSAGLAGAKRSTLPSSINADQLVPAVATAVNEVQSQPKPSESADTELLETLNRQVAELVKLSSRQLNVSQQTRSQLM